MIVLNKKSKKTLYLQIYEQFKEKIISGQLEEGSRLPSIRSLSDSLNISKNTVTYAYQQLCIEGYVANKTRSGFYIQEIDNHSFSLQDQNETPTTPDILNCKPDAPRYKYDFQYGRLAPGDFPIRLWRKLSNQILSPANLDKLVSYPDRMGETGLRTAIMKYLHNHRGVFCQPEQIVLCSGTPLSLSLLCQLLKHEHSSIAMEDPGYDAARIVFKNNGMNIIPIGLEKGGLNLNELEKSQAKIVYVTPSHQFPTGEIMPIQKRFQLLEWAAKNNSIIIEDDYDSELRYEGSPIPSIQNIDSKGQVIYLGTFSKSLSPALRLSYMVLSGEIHNKYQKAFQRYNTFVPWLDQKIVEAFIIQGHWEKHLRKVRLANKKRHDILIHTINKTMGKNVIVHGKNAGLHVILEFKENLCEKKLIKKAKDHGVIVYPVSTFWIRQEQYKNEMLLLGFSAMTESDIVEGINILNNAWFKN